VKTLAAIASPLVAVGLWIEVYALVIQLATDSCSFGYCALGHSSTRAAPHAGAAIAATLAVVVLGGMVALDWRLGRRQNKPAIGTSRSLPTALIVVIGIVVWFVALSFLTWGQPLGWIVAPGPCVPPEPSMNLSCDTETSAEAFHAYGPTAFLIATGAGAVALAVMLGGRRIATRLWATTA
jgi:hypothetical protein